MRSDHRKTSKTSKTARLAGVSAAAVMGATGLAACGDSAGPEQGEVVTEDLQRLEDQLSTLDHRVTDLEYEASAEGASPGDDVGAVEVGEQFWVDPESVLGQEVTVSAEVSEVVTENGAVFRIAGDSGDPVAVISASTPPELQVGDVVRVTGSVEQIERSSFEEDFGWTEEELFEDADDFFAEADSEVAISATEVTVLEQESAD